MPVTPIAPHENPDPGFELLVLGGGAAAAELHLPALARLGWMAGVTVCDPSPPRLAELAKRFPGLRTRPGDFRAALAEAQPQAVLVALPSALHEEAATAALERGVHVLCEKPLALTEAGARRLGALAPLAPLGNARRVTLAVAMVRRFFPSVRALAEALGGGLCGDLADVTVADGDRFRWPVASLAAITGPGGGALADMGVHFLDLLLWLFGPLTPVAYDDDWEGGAESNARLSLRTAAGVPLTLALSRTRELANLMRVRGSGGALEIGTRRHDVCHWRAVSLPETDVEMRPAGSSAGWSPLDAFVAQWRAFREACEGGAPPAALGTADDAAAAAAIFEWAYAERQRRTAACATAPAAPGPGLPPGRVGITGASGFIGGRLLARLWRDGHRDLSLPVRSWGSAAGIARFPVTPERVDLLDAAQVMRAIAGCRWVFHLAYGAEGPDAGRITVDGTRRVVEAAIATGAEAVVVLSSTYVYGHPPGATVDESFPHAPVPQPYGRDKQRMETWCLERARRTSGTTRIVVLQPACVYGAGSPGYTELPVALARKGRWAWIEGGSGTVNYVEADNLVDAMLLAAVTPAAHGQRFIISDGACTWRELLSPLLGDLAASAPSYTTAELEALHRGEHRSLLALAAELARDRRVANWIAGRPRLAALRDRTLAVLPGLAARIAAGKRRAATAAAVPGAELLPPRSLAVIFDPAQTVYSAARARDVLGWQPRVNLEEGTARARAALDGKQ